MPPKTRGSEVLASSVMGWLEKRRFDVYDWCMRRRTNIELDEQSVRKIMRRYHLRTMREAVDLALRSLAGQPMARADALAMRGARSIAELPADESPAGRR